MLIFIAKLFVSLVWAIIGLPIWISVIFRAFLIASFAFLLSAIVRTRVLYIDHERLNRSFWFYLEGFKAIWTNESPIENSDKLTKILDRELLYVASSFLMFWLPIFLFLLSINLIGSESRPADRNENIIALAENFDFDYVHELSGGLFQRSSHSKRLSRIDLLEIIYNKNLFSRNKYILRFRICNTGDNRDVLHLHARIIDPNGRRLNFFNDEIPSMVARECLTREISGASSDNFLTRENIVGAVLYLPLDARTLERKLSIRQ